ncbi:MAG: hypothetical protein AAFQ67_04030 [Pseudomonadota bacterium]
MKRRILVSVVIGSAAASNCSNGLGGVEAPDWFDDPRREIRGEGYPDLAAIPQNMPIGPISRQLDAQKSETDKIRATMLAEPRSAGVEKSPNDIRRLAAELAAPLRDREIDTSEFLTDDEIAAAKALFRGRAPKR